MHMTLVQLILKLCNIFIANHHNNYSQLAALKILVDFNSSAVVMTLLHMPNQKQSFSNMHTVENVGAHLHVLIVVRYVCV